MLSIKKDGKEVESPKERVLIIAFGLVVVVLAMVMAVALALYGTSVAITAFTAVLALVPVLIPIHFILRGLGRHGFITKKADGSLIIEISATSFRKN